MAENNSSAPLKTAEGEYPAPLIDGAWYWVRYFGLFKETEAPAQYKEACCAFYSVSFSGVPVAEVEILAPLAVAARAPAAEPLPLLVRDIARDLGITSLDACQALKGLGNFSVNSAVTADMARKLRECFPEATEDSSAGDLVEAPAGSGGWKVHAESLEKECAYWKTIAETMRAHACRDVWYWQGDGSDNPASMVSSLAVVIRADDLRDLMAKPAGSEAKALAALRYYNDECTGQEPSLSVFQQMADEALAAEVQAEPVAWLHTNSFGGVQAFTIEPPPGLNAKCQPLYTAPQAQPAFQQRVQPWMMACFGAQIAADRIERNHRFLEEALELVQATGCTQSEAHQLVDYVFGRPVGEPAQEVGGVMVTLAALCLANGLDMHQAGETELARVWTKVEAIRAKQAAKPKHSPLPQAQPADALDAVRHRQGVRKMQATSASQARKDGVDAADALHALAVDHGADRAQAAGFAHHINGAFVLLEGQIHDGLQRESALDAAMAAAQEGGNA